jgi:hypothetical protein
MEWISEGVQMALNQGIGSLMAMVAGLGVLIEMGLAMYALKQ